ncbi:MAG: hypothetical protein Q9209_005726 [Squamulea sp. 1 TL-2023]
MALSILKKRGYEATPSTTIQRPRKKVKRQTHYSSSSSTSAEETLSDFPAIDLADSASEEDIDLEDDGVSVGNEEHHADLPSTTNETDPASSTSAHTSGSGLDLDSEDSNTNSNQLPLSKTPNKRNDPTAFSTAIASILSSKLPTTKRADPVLARSSTALAANKEIKEAQVEKLARQSLRAEKTALKEKGRVKDVLLGTVNTGKAGKDREVEGGAGDALEGEVGRMMEQERRLKKTAQRGVVKLFNAVRMAQVRGEEARKEAVGKGIVGTKRTEEKVGEMSKKGFLELVASGGGGKAKGKMSGEGVEEA